MLRWIGLSFRGGDDDSETDSKLSSLPNHLHPLDCSHNFEYIRHVGEGGVSVVVSIAELLRLQREQHSHDKRNHADILCLPKPDRLKHYGLHFAKYVGRLARGIDEPKSIERTIVDTFLVGLSAANTLHQDLSSANVSTCRSNQIDPIYTLADAAGRFADACEKIDHLEEFMPIARQANIDVLKWTIEHAAERNVDLEAAVKCRRRELVARQFYVAD
jgi:hypothetical protein